jgi:[NiFe] hydrogenase assembly HybE family chaperone
VTGFEGSFLGDAGRVGAAASLECGVCWWVYDPARGDPVWQIPPGTPFTALPDFWRCPGCDAAPAQFMVLTAGHTGAAQGARQGSQTAPGKLAQQRQALVQAYARVGERMRDLPVYNPRLAVEVTALRRCDAGQVGVLATPWCMNLVLLSGDERRREGSSRQVAFPSGVYRFTAGFLAGFGGLESCSLFSPMHEFDDPAVVRAVAGHALTALFASPQSAGPAGAGSDAVMSRRRFLRRGTAP